MNELRLRADPVVAPSESSGPRISRFRRVRRFAFYSAVRGLVSGVRALPQGVATGLLLSLARVARMARPADRAAARRRVARAFPELDPNSARRRADQSWDRLAINLRDMVRTDARIEIEAEDLARLQAARERGPVLALMAHLGAWELAANALARHAAPFGALTANPHNPRVDRWLQSERAARGVHVFDRDADAAAATRFLRRGGTLAVLADHRPRGASVLGSWFGVEVPTTTGPGRMARIARARILPVAVERIGNGHRLVVGEGFEPTGDLHRDVARCNEALEEMIRHQPEEWTWLHARSDSR